jgi:serine/threonine-protein kinase RsbW
MNEMPPLPPVEVSLCSGDFAVREALQKLLAALGPLELEPEEKIAVELVVAEALNNIVEHAYPDLVEGGPIKIECRHRRDGLHINIVDQGEAMPNGQTPLGLAPRVDVNLTDLPEGGFGWFLIKDLAKDVAYARINGENRLHLRVAVAVH